MKIIKIDKNTVTIKLSLGRIDIKDNLDNPKEGKAVAIAINTLRGVEIKGVGTKLIVFKKRKQKEK